MFEEMRSVGGEDLFLSFMLFRISVLRYAVKIKQLLFLLGVVSSLLVLFSDSICNEV